MYLHILKAIRKFLNGWSLKFAVYDKLNNSFFRLYLKIKFCLVTSQLELSPTGGAPPFGVVCDTLLVRGVGPNT